MFALIIFQLYGQKWEETASQIENHLPLYQPFSICLLTDISRKDLPLLFNHSSSSSFVIVKKDFQIQCSQFFRGRFSFWFFCLLFIYRVAQNENASLNFEGEGWGLDFWQKPGLPPNSVGIVLGQNFWGTLFILAYPLSSSRLNGVQRRTEGKRKRH